MNSGPNDDISVASELSGAEIMMAKRLITKRGRYQP